MKNILSALLIAALSSQNVLAHPELFQIPWLLPSLDGTNQVAQAPQRAVAYGAATHQAAAPLQQQPQVVTPQLTYQGSQQAPFQRQAAHGVAQRTESNPVSSFDTERLTPLQPSTLPPLLTFPTQFPPNYFHQEALQSNSVTLPPHTAAYAPPAQPPVNIAQPPAPAQIAPLGQDASVGNFWFKEGTPVIPCAYGINPLPQYNTPRKRCVPHSPLCGFAFTCIVDV